MVWVHIIGSVHQLVSNMLLKFIVLPKFEVTVNPPVYILTSDKQIQGTVSAKYVCVKQYTQVAVLLTVRYSIVCCLIW